MSLGGELLSENQGQKRRGLSPAKVDGVGRRDMREQEVRMGEEVEILGAMASLEIYSKGFK